MKKIIDTLACSLRERHPIHSLNPFSLSSRGSPTSITKHGGGRTTSLLGQGRTSSRAPAASQDFSTGRPYSKIWSKSSLTQAGALSQPSTPFSPPLARHPESSRLSMISNNQVHSQAQSPYQHQPDDQHRLKQEDFVLSESPFRSSSSHHFFGLAGQNPLFTQDSRYPDLGSRTLSQAHASPSAFLPVDRDQTRAHIDSYDNLPQGSESDTIKVEHGTSITAEQCLQHRTSFPSRSAWDPTGDQHERGGGRPDDLGTNDLGI